MNARYKHIVLFIALLLVYKTEFAQKALDEVSVDLGSGVLTGAVPFDVPFIIKGKPDASVRFVKMRYKIKEEDFQKWMRYPKKVKGAYSDSVLWKAIPGQEFRLRSGPLHPNTGYVFEFFTYSVNTLTAEQKTKFKEDIMVIIEEAMRELDNTVVKISDANAKLNAAMSKLFPQGAEIVDKDLRPFSLDLYDGPSRPLTDQVMAINLQKLVDATLPARLDAFFISAGDGIALNAALKAVALDEDILNAAGLGQLPIVIDNANPAFSAITRGQLTKMLARDPENIKKILLGKSSIVGDLVKEVKEPDLNAIDLLKKYFLWLKGANLTLKDNTSLLTTTVTLDIPNVIEPLIDKAVKVHTANKELPVKRAQVLANFKDILEDKLAAFQLATNVSSVSDVVSDKNPYVGLDFGFSYIPGYEQIFFYQGVNFYFAPVNKDAPLKSFRGASIGEWLSKRVSIHFGITQSLIEVGNKRYLPLLKGIGSSALGGIGLRLNRIIRLNYGYMFFYEKDNNPVIDKKHLTIMPQFSITADVNVAKALGGVGKLLGIPQ